MYPTMQILRIQKQRHANPQTLVRNTYRSLKLKYIVHLCLIICCLNRLSFTKIKVHYNPSRTQGIKWASGQFFVHMLSAMLSLEFVINIPYQHPRSVIVRTSLIKKHCQCLSLNISVPFYKYHSLIICAPPLCL